MDEHSFNLILKYLFPYFFNIVGIFSMKIQVDFSDKKLASKNNANANGSKGGGISFKLAVLIWLTVQNSINSLLLRYSRVRDVPEMYFSTVAVFWMEVIKVIICLAMVFRNEAENGIFTLFNLLKRQIVDEPKDTLKVCIPSILYIFQNNLLYIAASHLNAATFMIASQLKIFTTAIFSMLLLKRSLLRAQWISLFFLFIGVSLVQLQPEEEKKKNGNAIDDNNKADEKATDFEEEQNSLTGLFSICIACALSGFSGVYFEKILKNSSSVSLWMRNIQMAVFALPVSLMAAYLHDGAKISEHGFMYGWDGIVWLTASWVAIGGLSVAVCIKYANNIAKNFATSVAIILATIGSIQIFAFQPSIAFNIGALLVILSIFLYSSAENFLNCWHTFCGQRSPGDKINDAQKRMLG